MLLLIIFAFLGGIVTILSPCILPILPIILSQSVDIDTRNKYKPIGVITGFILSFTIFTLLLSSIVKTLGIPSDLLRNIAIIIIGLFGITLVVPKFKLYTEKLFNKFSSKLPQTKQKPGFIGGILIGLSLGLLWTPCVGPILASVISLAIIGDVGLTAFIITFAYAAGTAIPLFFIMLGGRTALQKIPILTNNLDKIQTIFGYIMIATALMLTFNYDRAIQKYLLDTFPSYGTNLTKLEENELIEKQLNNLNRGKETGLDLLNNNSTTDDLLNGKSNLPIIGKAPELIQGGEWFNNVPLTLSELQGKVVIIDFWTYSCINCQRTLPYLKDWWDKYEDDGLVIIGVHSPEFEFEKEPKNVQKAINDFELKYPVMQDNDFKTWRSYNNRYWPAKYIIDKDGYVRYTHFGEGAYDETEEVIQTLLEEIGTEVNENIDNETYKIYSKTPETYLGFRRIEYLNSPENIVKNKYSNYSLPEKLKSNHFAFDGEVLITEEYSNPKKGSVLESNFEAKEVFLVMNSKSETSQVKIFVDGKIQYLGDDVSEDGIVTIDSDDLYKLIKLNKPGKHILRIEFLDDNTEIYAFTFG